MIKNFFGRHLIEIWGFFVFNLFKTNAILEVLDSTLKLKSNLHNFWKKNKNFWLSNVDFLRKKNAKLRKKGCPLGPIFFYIIKLTASLTLTTTIFLAKITFFRNKLSSLSYSMIKRAIKFSVFWYRSIFNSNKSISTDLADRSNGGNPTYGVVLSRLFYC
jgi:hypothetical protein